MVLTVFWQKGESLAPAKEGDSLAIATTPDENE